jgi:hypothetical protein
VRDISVLDFDSETRCEAWGLGNHGDAGPPVSQRRPSKRQRADTLEKLVETTVIPRLLLAHHGHVRPRPAEVDASTLAGRVGELSDLVIAADPQAAVEFVKVLRDQGVPLEALFQDLLAPTARRLGELWEEDMTRSANV